jgi:hypothetical protein
MPQANDAEIVRVYTRNAGGTVADRTPNISGGTPSFQVVVESEAGNTLAGGGASYLLSIEAFDLTAGNNPGGSLSAKTTPPGKIFDAGGATPHWPQNTEVFTISLTAAQVTALTNHVLRYTASLVSPDPASGLTPIIVSFAESEPFILIV